MRLLALFITLTFSLTGLSSAPDYTGKDTIENLCRKVDCHEQLIEYYKKYYFHQAFHKALYISYYKSGNKYINDYFGYSYREANTTIAKNEALSMCKKHGENCKLLLLNNNIHDKGLFKLLSGYSSSYSSSSNKTIPDNAYASNSDPNGWKCKHPYEKKGNGCIKRYKPDYSLYTRDGWKCQSGYTKNGNYCVKVPKNAYASGSGWKCKSGYKRVGASCEEELQTIYIDGDKYVGELKDDKPHGQGTYTYNDSGEWAGYKYVGEFKNGLRNGRGIFTYPNGEKYVGQFEDDYSSGQGTYYYSNGDKYIGGHKKGLSHGQGTYYYSNGDKYIGGYKNDKFHGQGTYTFGPNSEWAGDKYIGEFKDDNFHGQGTYIYSDGTKQEGVWVDGEFSYANKSSSSTTTSQDLEKVMPASSGSGFAVTSDGYVVTNYHVIQGCSSVEIYIRGRVIPSYIVGVDPQNDLAIIKGDFKPLYYYPLKRDNPKLLMDVFVAGFPFGFDISTPVKVTKGIVSSLSGVGNNYSNIQIDAAVQPGSSGGPILDDKGNVVAVTVAKLDVEKIIEEYGVIPEDTNFGIKSNVVVNFLESNSVKLPSPNIKKISNSELGEMITDGTYYLSCLMTQSQINKMREKKVMFNNID